MKILKALGILLLVLILAVFVAMIFTPAHYEVSRTDNLPQKQRQIYNALADLKTWPQWNPWARMDTTMNFKYGETTTGRGASYSWTSNNLGKGKVKLENVVPGREVEYSIKFSGMAPSNVTINLLPDSNNGTTINWRFAGDLPLSQRYMHWIIKKMVAPQLANGVENLNAYLNAQSKRYMEKFHVVRDTMPQFKYYCINFKDIRFSDAYHYLMVAFDSLYNFIGTDTISNCPPFAIYTRWDTKTKTCDFEVGMRAVHNRKSKDGIQLKQMKGGPIIEIDYFGNIVSMVPAYFALNSYLTSNQLHQVGGPVEYYPINPVIEPDTDKWKSKVVFFVSPDSTSKGNS